MHNNQAKECIKGWFA